METGPAATKNSPAAIITEPVECCVSPWTVLSWLIPLQSVQIQNKQIDYLNKVLLKGGKPSCMRDFHMVPQILFLLIILSAVGALLSWIFVGI